jgi:outer membrane protein assembly factor BamB
MILTKIIPITAVLVALFLMAFWFNTDPPQTLQVRVPGTDKTAEQAAQENGPPVLSGELVKFNVEPSDLPGLWPRFRGSDYNNLFQDNQITLGTSWGETGPAVLWSIDVGEGHAGASVRNGRVYVMDYDRDQQADTLRCLSLADGRDIWRFSYPVKIKRNHGMSRTVPAVTDKFVVAMGPKCHMTCLDAITGEQYWMMDLVRDYETKVPPWYAGQCPLIDGDRTIIAPGGKAMMIAVDCATGEIIWQTENPHDWKMTHSSIIPMDFAGKRMYVYCGSGGVAGVSADDGSILWETSVWKIRIANVPSPVIIGAGKIFLSGGYNSGSMMLQLKDDNGTIIPEVVFHLEPEVFGSAQQTPILYQGHIYGVRPDEQLICLDLEGNEVWTSGSDHKFGLGPYLIANNLIYVMNDSGLLTLAEATPSGYRQLAQAQVLQGHDSWGPMALAGGRLILRDLTKMVCLDIAEK